MAHRAHLERATTASARMRRHRSSFHHSSAAPWWRSSAPRRRHRRSPLRTGAPLCLFTAAARSALLHSSAPSWPPREPPLSHETMRSQPADMVDLERGREGRQRGREGGDAAGVRVEERR